MTDAFSVAEKNKIDVLRETLPQLRIYVVWYTNDASQFLATPRKATGRWFWENSTTIWRYTTCKILLIFGFIITAVVESARIDLAHVITHFDVEIYVVLGILVFVTVLLFALNLYIVPRHHQIINNMAILYDDVSANQTFVHL